MSTPLLVIGGGLSGIAAAIRTARFIPGVLLIEQHHRLGGLNSFFYRNGHLLETGLHAITNFSPPGDKRAPLNRLLRQLKLKRDDLSPRPQKGSRIIFPGNHTIVFGNEFEELRQSVNNLFPASVAQLDNLVRFLDEYDPFSVNPFRSAKQFLSDWFPDRQLVDMLLCPLMYYGSSVENDMDLSQFAIMFRAIFLEGMFRPAGTIKDLLDLFVSHYRKLGGQLKTSRRVERIVHKTKRVTHVVLSDGTEIECQNVLSTIGLQETLALLSPKEAPEQFPEADRHRRLAFMENIFQLPTSRLPRSSEDTTIIFYSRNERFNYARVDTPIDISSGVICFPSNFHDLPQQEMTEIRTTHLASYDLWKDLRQNPKAYKEAKLKACEKSMQNAEEIIGGFSADVVYHNSFTPVTIERYTSKLGGAIYGSPYKVKDGDIGFSNLFLAGTDQGFLGIVGAMLSGVSITNQHILPKL